MAKKKQTWVSPSEGEWKVHHENAERATKIFETKKEAEEFGRALSKKMGTEFIIQNKDGLISRKDSHGNDPSNILG